MKAFLKRWFPPASTDRGVNLALLVFAGAGAAWIAKNTEDWPSLRIWWSVLSGENLDKVALADYMRGGWLAAALVWTAVSLALLGFRGLAGAGKDPRAARSPAGFRPGRPLLLGLLLVVVLAAGLRWPRMNLSLYNDEVFAYRISIAGEFDRRAAFDLENDAIPEFHAVPWTQTLWGNRVGNNHALYSVTARLAHDFWKRAAGAVDGQIREWPLRLPSLLGGLLSIAAVGILTARVTRSSLAGLLGALFLAVHPWHIRYSTEARGYGLLFAFVSLAALFLVIAFDKRRPYRWWTAFALAQAACLWSYLGSAYFLVGLNLAAAGLLFAKWLRERPPRPLGQPMVQGWVWANCLTLLLLFLTQAPNLAQLKQAMVLDLTFRGKVEFDWLTDMGSYFLMGMPWHDGDPGNTLNPALSKYIAQPVVFASLLVAVALAGTGMVSLLRRSPDSGWLLVAAPLLAIGSQFLFCLLSSSTLLTWYVIYGIIFVPVWMAAGSIVWVSFHREPDAGRSPAPLGFRRRLILYGIVTVYLLGITPAIVRYRNTGKQALRPAIELIRGGTYPFVDGQRQPILCGWWTHANFYDPTFKIAHTREALNTLIQRARTENRPLFFVLGMRSIALEEDPAVIDLLENSGKFEIFKVLPGLEERQFRTTVYRLLP